MSFVKRLVLALALLLMPVAALEAGRVVREAPLQECDSCCRTYCCRGGDIQCITDGGGNTCYKGGSVACPASGCCGAET